MLTTKAYPSHCKTPLQTCDTSCRDLTGAQCDVRRQNTKALLLFVQDDEEQRSLSSQEVKPSIRLIQYTVTYTRLKGKKTTRD